MMARFRAGELDVLVATTVIEVGVDVPNATIMIVQEADRFGLAQLHQLRGRVGRGAEQSYCLLVSRPRANYRGGAAERLEALVATTDGFELAERDLEIRGEGQLLGARQSGLSDLRFVRLRRDQALLERAGEVASAFDEGLLAFDVDRLLGEAGISASPEPAMRIVAGSRKGWDRGAEGRHAGADRRPSEAARGRRAGRRGSRPRPVRGLRGRWASRRSPGARPAASSWSASDACRVIERNLEKLRLTGAVVLCQDVLAACARSAHGVVATTRPRGRPYRSGARPKRRSGGCSRTSRRGRARGRRDVVAGRAELPSRPRHLAALRFRTHPGLLSMITAICPGSYDPVTNGHVDVIRRAASIFDRVVVGVVQTPQHKETLFPSRSGSPSSRTRCPGARTSSWTCSRSSRSSSSQAQRGRWQLRSSAISTSSGVRQSTWKLRARAGDRDGLRHVEPLVQLRLLERRSARIALVRRQGGRGRTREAVARRFAQPPLLMGDRARLTTSAAAGLQATALSGRLQGFMAGIRSTWIPALVRWGGRAASPPLRSSRLCSRGPAKRAPSGVSRRPGSARRTPALRAAARPSHPRGRPPRRPRSGRLGVRGGLDRLHVDPGLAQGAGAARLE